MGASILQGILFIDRSDIDWILWALWYTPKHRGKVWSRWLEWRAQTTGPGSMSEAKFKALLRAAMGRPAWWDCLKGKKQRFKPGWRGTEGGALAAMNAEVDRPTRDYLVSGCPCMWMWGCVFPCTRCYFLPVLTLLSPTPLQELCRTMQPPQDPEAEVISQDRMLKLAKDRQAEAAGHLGGPSGHLGCPSGHLGGPTGHLGGSSKGSNMGNTNAAGTQVRGPPGYCPKCLVAGHFQCPYVFHNGGACPNANLATKPSGSTAAKINKYHEGHTQGQS